MAPHEEFLKLCAVATAGEMNPDELEKLDAHLIECAECRRAMHEYEMAARHSVAALASERPPDRVETDSSWSVEEAEKAFFKRLDNEADGQKASRTQEEGIPRSRGQRFTYRPSQIHWREVWMPFAAAVLLSVALGIAAYRSGIKRGTEVAQSTSDRSRESAPSLEEQVSDAGHERAQLTAKLTEQDRVIADLKRQLSEEQKAVNGLKTAAGAGRPALNAQQLNNNSTDLAARRGEELAAAQAKLEQLQATIETMTSQREELTSHAATLEAKVGELTQLVRDRERDLDQKQAEVARQQDLLEHDRDIRELMGARDLYVAEVHDVAGTGQTNRTYGRVFFTKGKRLVFYAYDLDAQPGVQNASTFQAWGRRGPDKQQALNLGIFYEDNISKKRWVLKTNDPKTLEDIDAVFVTVEPNGGSHHPSGKQLLFAYLRLNPNHP